jgi:hypothetical protein
LSAFAAAFAAVVKQKIDYSMQLKMLRLLTLTAQQLQQQYSIRQPLLQLMTASDCISGATILQSCVVLMVNTRGIQRGAWMQAVEMICDWQSQWPDELTAAWKQVQCMIQHAEASLESIAAATQYWTSIRTLFVKLCNDVISREKGLLQRIVTCMPM